MDLCDTGKADAMLYHKRYLGNFTPGYLFNLVGIVGVAVTEPKETGPKNPGYIRKIYDPEYKTCWIQGAGEKNIRAAGIGWETSLVFLIIIL